MLSLIPADSPILRTPCAPVTDIAAQVTPFVDDMLKVMRANGGAGLAAPQVGIPYRFFVADWPPHIPNCPQVFVNPLIVGHGKLVVEALEGCLSFPGQERLVARHHAIDIEYTAHDGSLRRERVKGRSARLVSHEINHLDGICIVPAGMPAQPDSRPEPAPILYAESP